MMQDYTALVPLTAKLQRLGSLDDGDLAAFLALPWHVRGMRSSEFVCRQGGRTAHCTVLLSGLAIRDHMTGAGARQISGLFFPGDLMDYNHAALGRTSDTIQLVEEGRVATVPSRELLSLASERPGVALLLSRDTMIDASITREWTLNIGRRDAKTRLLHLICEFAVRQEQAGILHNNDLMIPLTQEQLGDALGLTAVHINRVFAAFRRDVAIERLGRTVRIKDWKLLRQLADFNDDYLHIVKLQPSSSLGEHQSAWMNRRN